MQASEVRAFVQQLPNLSEVEPEAIDWLLEKSTITSHPKDEFIFQTGDPVDELFIILEGLIDVFQDTPDGRKPLFLIEKGDIAGNLPFSRAKSATAAGKVIEKATILRLSKSYFTEMVSVSYAMTQALVAVMSDRIRSISSRSFQDEKLKALGKISAGLAHELNNPASAMVRSAEVLYQKLSETPDNFKAVMQLNVTAKQTDSVNANMFEKIEARKTSPQDMGLLERQDRIDDLTDWLEDHDVDEAEEIAETLADFNFEEDDLEQMLEALDGEEPKLGPVLHWFDNRLSIEILLEDIREASRRVADLVQSVKKYSHMDQGGGKKAIDIHDGIRTTLAILGHRFKQKQISIDKQFDPEPPMIQANPGELNQVWTNLLANSIDALPEGGTVNIRSKKEYGYLCLEFEDNGTGIPEHIQNRIWEPFFTTKEVGEGTGIGLDVVKNIIQMHRGSISVESKPGKTVFTIKFLID